jgi:hypothetical protein
MTEPLAGYPPFLTMLPAATSKAYFYPSSVYSPLSTLCLSFPSSLLCFVFLISLQEPPGLWKEKQRNIYDSPVPYLKHQHLNHWHTEFTQRPPMKL